MVYWSYSADFNFLSFFNFCILAQVIFRISMSISSVYYLGVFVASYYKLFVLVGGFYGWVWEKHSALIIPTNFIQTNCKFYHCSSGGPRYINLRIWYLKVIWSNNFNQAEWGMDFFVTFVINNSPQENIFDG